MAFTNNLKKNLIKLAISLSFAAGLVSCQQPGFIDVLQQSCAYEETGPELNYSFSIDEVRAREIRDYFSAIKDSEGNILLDLNSLNASSEPTLDKVFTVATFVSKNIKHKNQIHQIEKQDAISLWEFHRDIESDFNCKFHSIFTNELLLSIGIVNNYVWCMPKSDKDTDCHVVNNVWIPELHKWVMIDTDQCYYIQDLEGQYLSIGEIREKMYNGNMSQLKASSFYKVSQSTSDYLNYLSKDFYWFLKNQKIRFIKSEGIYLDENKIVDLLTPAFNGYRLRQSDIITRCDSDFWSAPDTW